MSQARRFLVDPMRSTFGERSWRAALASACQALLLGAVVVWPLFADGATDGTDASEKAIHEALGSSTKLEFADTPLADAIQFLGDAHQVMIRLDRAALEEAGVGTDTPVTVKLNGVTLRSALRLMLDPLKLAPVVHEGVLLITTEDEAQNMLKLRVYPAGDLLDNPNELIQAITASIEPDSWDEVGGRGSLQLFGDLLIISQSDRIHNEIERLLAKVREARAGAPVAEHAVPKAEEPKADDEGMVVRTYVLGGQGATEEFAQLVTSIVAPSAWSDNGGQGTIRRVGPLQFSDGLTLGGALIVRQTPDVHAQVDRFLSQLRSLATPMRYPRPVAGGFGGGGRFGAGGPAPAAAKDPAKEIEKPSSDDSDKGRS